MEQIPLERRTVQVRSNKLSKDSFKRKLLYALGFLLFSFPELMYEQFLGYLDSCRKIYIQLPSQPPK